MVLNSFYWIEKQKVSKKKIIFKTNWGILSTKFSNKKKSVLCISIYSRLPEMSHEILILWLLRILTGFSSIFQTYSIEFKSGQDAEQLSFSMLTSTMSNAHRHWKSSTAKGRAKCALRKLIHLYTNCLSSSEQRQNLDPSVNSPFFHYSKFQFKRSWANYRFVTRWRVSSLSLTTDLEAFPLPIYVLQPTTDSIEYWGQKVGYRSQSPCISATLSITSTFPLNCKPADIKNFSHILMS